MELEKEFVDEHAAAEFLGLKVGTLRSMRCYHKGPPYVKAGRRYVRYGVEDLREWMNRHRVEPEG